MLIKDWVIPGQYHKKTLFKIVANKKDSLKLFLFSQNNPNVICMRPKIPTLQFLAKKCDTCVNCYKKNTVQSLRQIKEKFTEAILNSI